jgi:tetratricopeptide (TPR) repeat protein
MRETVELSIPFESLIGAVEKLNLAEKRRLWELLQEQLAQADEVGATGEGLPPHLDALLQVAGALWRFWYKRGHLSEGMARLDRALAQDSSVLATIRAEALRGLGILSYMLGDNRRASQLYREALASFQKAGDKKGAAATLDHLAMVAHYQGDHERAAALYQEALDLQRALGDTRGTASTLNNLGNLAQDRGDYQQATAMWEEASAMFRAAGDKHSVAGLLCNLGRLAQLQREPSRAAALYEESLRLHREQ